MTEEAQELTIDSLSEEALSKEASPTDEKSIVGEEANEKEPKPGVKGKTPYSDDEFQALNFDQIDAERLSDGHKTAYEFAKQKASNLEKAYNQKYMELAEQRKAIDTIVQQQKELQARSNPHEWLIQEFEKNPQATVNELDNSIFSRRNELERLKMEVFADPYAEGIEAKKAELIQKQEDLSKLEFYRRGLDRYASQKTIQMNQVREIQAVEQKYAGEVIEEIRKEYPDYDKNREAINSFAETLGYNQDQVIFLTNPVRLASANRISIEDAKRLAKTNANAIIKLYKYEQLVSKGKNKLRQANPNPLARATASKEEDEKDNSYEAIDKRLTMKGL